MKKLILFLFLFIVFGKINAQQIGRLYGVVSNEKNQPLEYVNVYAEKTNIGVATNESGAYLLELKPNIIYKIIFSFIGFTSDTTIVKLAENETKQINIILKSKYNNLSIVHILDQQNRIEGLTVIDPTKISSLPNPSQNLEGFIKMLAGVTSNNELSSQYNVRGGNFDENLVYVNDFEIYRPQLIRSSQQEGLSFANPDMVKNIKFSAGGFAAKYGDKLASVLDIQYKQPKKFGGSVGLSIYGQTLSLEGASKNRRLTYLFGFRNKTNRLLLASQQTKGQYRPVFNDAQTFVTYNLTDNIELQAIVNINQNKFKFIPESRVTSFGLVNRTLRLTVYFDGQEIDQFNSNMGGLALIYRPTEKLKLKFMGSGFITNESETFDIIGQYFIGEVETDINKQNYNQIKYNLGIGEFQDFGRNYLTATVINASHLGSYINNQNYLQWGLKIQQETIDDKLKEWHRIDSTGYNIPYDTTTISMYNYVKADNYIQSIHYSGFIQNTFNISDTSIFKIVTGMRFNYWNFNKELLFSPRVQISYLPNWHKDVVFRLSGGAYNQYPFYREMRDFNGEINTNIKAQQSWHLLLGGDYNFKIWKRPFSFSAEAFYKYMTNVIPYEYDNVRVRYFAKNNAFAYATGLDCRLNGQFVKDAESWISLSFLKTQENLVDDYERVGINAAGELLNPRLSEYEQDKVSVRDTFIYPKWIPKPTDQRVNVALYFSDYVPNHKNFKVHLNAIYGTGIPFGPPNHIRVRDTLRIPPYRRVDIGFSALLLDGSKDKYKGKYISNVNTIWASLEVFNLLGVTNTVSYLWVRDLYSSTYAVPNYLTARRFNLKLTCTF